MYFVCISRVSRAGAEQHLADRHAGQRDNHEREAGEGGRILSQESEGGEAQRQDRRAQAARAVPSDALRERHKEKDLDDDACVCGCSMPHSAEPRGCG